MNSTDWNNIYYKIPIVRHRPNPFSFRSGDLFVMNQCGRSGVPFVLLSDSDMYDFKFLN